MKTKETTNRGIGKCIIFLMVILFSTVSFSAHAASYGFKIGGIEVTSSNYNDITASYITSGTVKYNPSTNTVTLTNVTITRTGNDNRAVQSDREGLIIKCVGTCKLSATSASVIRFNKKGSIVVASGTTTVTGGTERHIRHRKQGILRQLQRNGNHQHKIGQRRRILAEQL